MKTIGIIGGMSWESSIEYYRITNQITRKKLGGLHSSPSVMVSVDFAPIEELQNKGDWGEATKIMIDTARQVVQGGADFIIIATNTMHLMFDEVQKAVGVPLLHIADATAMKIKERGFKSIGLLGTIFTMEMDFYKGRLINDYGIDVLIPDTNDGKIVNRVIYEELVLGEITEKSKNEYLRIMEDLKKLGAEGIILGCTEISLLVNQKDTDIPLFDTTFIHAETAVEIALGEKTI